LSAFGFGPNYVRWFNLLHKNSNAQVIVNGFLTESFDVQSGVRQGCPWAPFLFLVGIEPFACALRKTPTVQGIDLPNGKKLLIVVMQMTLLFFFPLWMTFINVLLLLMSTQSIPE
jgi:hypothetical protein